MSEVKEYLDKSGHPTETLPLDPRVEEAGVEHVDEDDKKKWDEVNQMLREQHPEHYAGNPANLPIGEPLPLSEQQVNGIPVASVPTDTPDESGLIPIMKATLSNLVDSFLHPEFRKDFLKKGVGNTEVSKLPIKQKSSVQGSQITNIPGQTHNQSEIQATNEEVAHAA